MYKIKINFLRSQQEIFIGNDLIRFINLVIKKQAYDKIVVFVDSKVNIIHKEFTKDIEHKLKYVFINTDTSSDFKNYNSLKTLLLKLSKYNLSRKSCLLVIGGGSIGDTICFLASIYMRGIDMLYIPTTFMLQCDSIIGKVAIDFLNQKNLLGSFYSPRFTFCDLKFLKSLNNYQKICGFVEIWKHGIIKNDKSLIELMILGMKNLDDIKLSEKLIYKSLLIKKQIVSNDLYDNKNKHKVLSLGHTIANYLEKNGKINHGEAVLYGILFETLLSIRLKKISTKSGESILEVFKIFNEYINKNAEVVKILNLDKMMEVLKKDKINSHNKYNFIIPNNDGCEILSNVSVEIIQFTVKDLTTYLCFDEVNK